MQRVPPAAVRPRNPGQELRGGRLSAGGRRRSPRHPPVAQTRPHRRTGSTAIRHAVSRTLAWPEELASSRRGALVLFVLGLAVYAIRAIGWPLVGGRDLDEYLYDYVQFLDWHPLLPWSMLFRTPVTPVVAGLSLDVAHGFFAEPLLAVFFSGAVVLWGGAAPAVGAGA